MNPINAIRRILSKKDELRIVRDYLTKKADTTFHGMGHESVALAIDVLVAEVDRELSLQPGH
ncbi:MAG: hypothetical protein WC711_02710 [Candidatus Staskawiczbacteria bacterium]|jgi:hypothetical protein